VTFLFTDIEGSTQLWERQPDHMPAALERHDEILHAALESHGGVVFSTAGDGVGAAFTRAADALTAAIQIQRALAEAEWSGGVALRVRMALHTGEAHERNGDYFGSTLNRAARLMAAAHGSQVLCSRATADVVRDALPTDVSLIDLGEHHLRDLTRPEHVFQVTHRDLAQEFPPLRSREASPSNLPAERNAFVGRERDITAVTELLTESRVVTLTGVGGARGRRNRRGDRPRDRLHPAAGNNGPRRFAAFPRTQGHVAGARQLRARRRVARRVRDGAARSGAGRFVPCDES
jgi:class 3 adenylate cyclase